MLVQTKQAELGKFLNMRKKLAQVLLKKGMKLRSIHKFV